MTRVGWFPPLLAFGVFITGCTTGAGELDMPAVEKEITDGVKDQAELDVTVECPNQMDIEPGRTFNCVVTPETGGAVLKAEVTIENDDGYITWEIV